MAIKIFNKTMTAFCCFTLLNCSHIPALNSVSKDEFLQSINDNLVNENVVVYTSEKQKIEGKLVKINDTTLVLDSLGIRNELNTEKIDSLKYWGDSVWGGVATGSTAGFILGYAITEFGDVRLDFGGGSNNAGLIFAIPVLTVVGGVIGGIAAANKARTIYFKNWN
jgi:hypothetical protein